MIIGLFKSTKEVKVKLKEYVCAKVGHHKDVGKTIEEWQEKGWRLHTYSCAQAAMGEIINHYLLFEREG